MKKQKKNILIYMLSLLLMLTALTGCGRASYKAVQQDAGASSQTVQVSESSSDTELVITALKAGAADAFVLIAGDHVTLIDTGLDKKADKLVAFLKEQGVSRIDEMIITHFDKDHVGGADHILAEFEVGTVYTTYRSKDSDDITSYTQALLDANLTETVVRDITSFEAGGVSFTIYPPLAQSYASDVSNNSSLVIKVSVGENSMLFAGDAEDERIRELLATPGLESVILKVPHHGRLAAGSREFAEYVAPEYAIITSSNSEPEDPELIDILDSLGVTTYLTKNGNITITMSESEVSISQ